jgi:hypothetical protein
MNEEEQQITLEAKIFAKKNKNRIAKEITDSYPNESSPVSVFMAGSPGQVKLRPL